MRHIIENDYLKIEVSELGATLCKFIDKKSNTDIVLGFDDDQQYLDNIGSCMGASVGRSCNRIAYGKMSINDVEYQLTTNCQKHQLHGGYHALQTKMWDLVEKSDNELKLSCFSCDKEDGYPGNLSVYVTYKLDDNNLIWSYEGECDKDSILNMTNHSYFNLGDIDTLNHKLQINTMYYSENDETSLAYPNKSSVLNTPYDFTKESLVKDKVLKLEYGIDNNYVFETMNDKHMAKLSYKQLELNIYSDLPDLHHYSTYWLHANTGKYGQDYKAYTGICLEPQFYPNAINYDGVIKPIIKKGEIVYHYIRYEIKNNQ